MSQLPFKHILFDLDGTLLDSALDITHALNQMRKARNLPPMSYEKIRPSVSLGSPGLLKLCFGIELSDPNYDKWRQEFFHSYQRYMMDNMVLFPGTIAMLDELDAKNIPWGIVTNKITSLTKTTLKALKLLERSKTLVCADTLANKKPHPEPMLYACRQLGSDPSKTIYIGDAKHDVIAAHPAGMPAAVVTYGYIPEDDVAPTEWGAEYLFNTVGELHQFLVGRG